MCSSILLVENGTSGLISWAINDTFNFFSFCYPASTFVVVAPGMYGLVVVVAALVCVVVVVVVGLNGPVVVPVGQ